MNERLPKIYRPFFNLSISLGIKRSGGESTEYESELFANLRLSDCFAIPDVSVRMSPEIYTSVSAGKHTSLEMIRSYGKPMPCLKSKQGDSVLHLAAACGHVELVKSFVSECPRLLLELDSRDQLPLHVAAHASHVDVVEVLIVIITFVSATLSAEGKESLNLYVVKDVNGDTPLHIALRASHMDTADCLVNANQQASFLPNENGKTPLYMAVEAGYVSLVKGMLKTTDNDRPNLQLQGIKCLVHAALKARNTDLLRIILNKYSSLEDERDGKGNTCLSYGASIGFNEGVRMLLRRSTKSVYVANDDGSFPIHIAAEKGHIYILIVILERCPESIYLLNKDAQNMLHIVSKSGRLSFVLFSYLRDRSFMNKLMEKQDTDGNTPLHLATINWHYHTLFYLLNNHSGNCMNIRNKMGQTPLYIAESNLQSRYNYMERMTLLVLYMYSKTYYKSLIKRKKRTRSDAPAVDNKAQLINTILVVAALVATVTFAAGFTIPGGFNSSSPNLGSAALATDVKLICFMVFDILAMLFSILTIVTLIWGQLGDPALVQKSLNVALPSLFSALICMPVGFYCGIYIAFAHVKGFLIFLNVTSVIFVFLFIISLGPHVILHVPVIPRLCGMVFRVTLTIVGYSFHDGVPFIMITFPYRSFSVVVALLLQRITRIWRRSFASLLSHLV